MKFTKTILTAAAVCALTTACNAAESGTVNNENAVSEENGNSVNVVVNGKTADISALIVNDRTLVPLRGVYEKLGYTVDWDAETKTASFTGSSDKMTVNAADGSVMINGKAVSSDVPAQLINDRLYLPLRAASEGLGLGVEWNADTRTVYVKEGINGNMEKPADTTASTNSFAFKLNEEMPRNENYMFSPLSIKMALALTANGAEGETKTEMLNTLGITDIDKYNAFAEEFIAKYADNGEESAEQDETVYPYREKHSKVCLNVANSLWLNKTVAGGIAFNADYVKKMQQYYDAELESVDNSNAVQKINGWCSDKTKGKINRIIDDPAFLAALVNAVYFKGEWATQFDEYATGDDTFTDRNGKENTVKFMNKTEDFAYYEDNDVQLVKMPYYGSNIAMYVALTDDKRTDITPYMDKMSYEEVHIKMPKFKTEYDVKLNDYLIKLGMGKAFLGGRAEFSPMFEGGGDFYIDQVLHKTYIDVDENGTEAAAVTAVMMKVTSAVGMEKPQPKQFIANKPFSYYIVDDDSKEILFMGEYAFAK